MEQWEYKCKAHKDFGQHDGPEVYECTVTFGDKTTFPICEKHAIGDPYGTDSKGHFIVKSATGFVINQKSASICFLANDKFGYGQCDGQVTHEFKSQGILDKSKWYPLCEKHVLKYESANLAGAGWEIRPLCGQPAVDSVAGAKLITKEKMAGGWTVRTQKARGIATLKKSYFDMPEFSIYDVEGIEPSVLIGKFARPCPMRPRHGFVDSRKIENEEQAAVIIKETLEADPEAEFVIMPFVDANYSGIWTPGHLAIGLGTDGATTGKTAITIPAIGSALWNNGMGHSPDYINELAGVKEAPYVELLWAKKHGELITKFVQLRDGPKLPNQIDYIPVKFKVETIIKATGDLLAWEARMREINSCPGYVIDHVGGSLASHYAIHAVLNNIPVLVSRHPVLGETLEPTQDVIQPVDIQALRAGFTIAQKCEMDYKDACYVMLAGCHHVVAWSGKQDLLLGFAMGFAWRLTLIASLGERRHHRRSAGGRRNIKNRNQVYSGAWEHTDEPYTRKRFMESIDCFLNGNRWPGAKFGGRSWYKFASNAVNMYNALINKEPAKALEALNQLVHSAHNTGWGFNKFIDNEELDKTARNPVYACLKIAPFLYQMATQPDDTLKSAARSFWKRSTLVLPHDRGTGSYNDGDERDCESCQKGEEEGDEIVASANRTTYKMQEVHKVTYAQAKLEAGKVHIQWKSDRMHGKEYFTKNKIVGGLAQGDFEHGDQTVSLAGSCTFYTKLEPGLEGWYLPAPGMKTPGYLLLDLEEIPAESTDVNKPEWNSGMVELTNAKTDYTCPCNQSPDMGYPPHSGLEIWEAKGPTGGGWFKICEGHKLTYENANSKFEVRPIVKSQLIDSEGNELPL